VISSYQFSHRYVLHGFLVLPGSDNLVSLPVLCNTIGMCKSIQFCLESMPEKEIQSIFGQLRMMDVSR
jgi:hypothetical protein